VRWTIKCGLTYLVSESARRNVRPRLRPSERASERARAAMRWHCVLGFCPAVRLLLIAAPSRQYSRRGSALVVCDGFVAAPLCSRPPVVSLLARCLGWQRCCCCCCCLMPLSCDQSARCTAVRHHSAAELSRARLCQRC